MKIKVDLSNEAMFEHLVSDDAKCLISEMRWFLKQDKVEDWYVKDFVYNVKALAAYFQLTEHYAIPEDQVTWIKEMLK